jgi:putative FmdB family regulatory protein
MPIYEYRCRECSQVSSFVLLRADEPFTPRCRHCRGSSLERLLSRVHVRLSEETRFERMGDLDLAGVDENNPASLARALKKMGPLMGDDFSPEEVDQMVEEAASGQGAEEDRGGAEDTD